MGDDRMDEQALDLWARRALWRWAAIGAGIALVLVLAVSQLVSRSDDTPDAAAGPPVKISNEQVSLFAIEAAVREGLRADYRFFDFKSTTRSPEGWSSTFAITECVFLPRKKCGRAGTARLLIEQRGKRLEIVDLQGDVDSDEQVALTGTTGRPPKLKNRLELAFGGFIPNEMVPEAARLNTWWHGAIPTAFVADCRLQVLAGPPNKILWEKEFTARSPATEDARDGLMMTELPKSVHYKASFARASCKNWRPA